MFKVQLVSARAVIQSHNTNPENSAADHGRQEMGACAHERNRKETSVSLCIMKTALYPMQSRGATARQPSTEKAVLTSDFLA